VALASLSVLLVLAACSGDEPEADRRPQSPSPPTTSSECGEVRIAYDPSNGYEASAFIVGEIAAQELDCEVRYLPANTRDAWRMVAAGEADVYLDAYGSSDLRATFARRGGPIRVVGPNGIIGGVDLLAPYFMGENGLISFRDLEDDDIGWGSVTPAITTVPELVPLARQFVDNVGLDYLVRDFVAVGAGNGIGDLIRQVDKDNALQQPATYLAAAPRSLLGDGPARISVQLPDSAGEGCELVSSATLCSLEDFRYLKIANREFAESGSPAYALVFAYRLSPHEVENVMELVELSGYEVRPVDVVSWINTHRNVWSAWLS
jgi:glycine betaine/proline transport system substrate-binding protein